MALTNWSDLGPTVKRVILAFLIIVIILCVLAWYGYFTGAWDTPQPT